MNFKLKFKKLNKGAANCRLKWGFNMQMFTFILFIIWKCQQFAIARNSYRIVVLYLMFSSASFSRFVIRIHNKIKR